MPWIKIDRWIAKCDGCGMIFQTLVKSDNELVPYTLIEYFADKDSDVLTSEGWYWDKSNDKLYCPDLECEKLHGG